MKKLSLVLVLILSFAFMGFADNPEGQTPTQKNGFKIKPKLFLSGLSEVIYSFSQNKFSLTFIGLDFSLLNCGNFYFLAVGGGIGVRYVKELGWHQYYDYWGYSRWYYGEGYEFKFNSYFKIVPVKWCWQWLSKQLKAKTYLEAGFDPWKKSVILGLSFGVGPFNKKKKEE